MPSTTVPTSSGQRRASRRSGEALRHRHARHSDPPLHDRAATSDARRSLGQYVDSAGRSREIVAERAAQGSVLVVDHEARTLADRRLVAHLAPDEPAANAEVVTRCYLEQATNGRCRPVADSDLLRVPFAEGDWEQPLAGRTTEPAAPPVSAPVPLDGADRSYRLVALSTGMSIPELRWCRFTTWSSRDGKPVSVREAIGDLERYEPICAITAEAVGRARGDASLSIAVLRAELSRVRESPILLNRCLREAVLAAVERDGLSLSEVAMRCGRLKRDAAGNCSGETSWLARRLGMMPEGGRQRPTPWVHSDVLALIARDGLGLSPREVESS
jgi:hypothetical protein